MKPTKQQFQMARHELLATANCYEPVRRKVLRGVFYDNQLGCFRWIGKAYDYSYSMP